MFTHQTAQRMLAEVTQLRRTNNVNLVNSQAKIHTAQDWLMQVLFVQSGLCIGKFVYAKSFNPLVVADVSEFNNLCYIYICDDIEVYAGAICKGMWVGTYGDPPAPVMYSCSVCNGSFNPSSGSSGSSGGSSGGGDASSGGGQSGLVVIDTPTGEICFKLPTGEQLGLPLDVSEAIATWVINQVNNAGWDGTRFPLALSLAMQSMLAEVLGLIDIGCVSAVEKCCEAAPKWWCTGSDGSPPWTVVEVPAGGTPPAGASGPYDTEVEATANCIENETVTIPCDGDTTIEIPRFIYINICDKTGFATVLPDYIRMEWIDAAGSYLSDVYGSGGGTIIPIGPPFTDTNIQLQSIFNCSNVWGDWAAGLFGLIQGLDEDFEMVYHGAWGGAPDITTATKATTDPLFALVGEPVSTINAVVDGSPGSWTSVVSPFNPVGCDSYVPLVNRVKRG